MLRNAAQRLNNNANPSGLSNFVGKVEISVYSKNHFGAIVIGFCDT